jgi:hypothetical protein
MKITAEFISITNPYAVTAKEVTVVDATIGHIHKKITAYVPVIDKYMLAEIYTISDGIHHTSVVTFRVYSEITDWQPAEKCRSLAET